MPAPARRRLAVVILCFACSAAVAAETWQGRPLREYLEALGEAGLRIIYSTDLVRESYRVREEPRSTSPEAALREVLEPFGLVVEDGPGDALLITKVPTAPPRKPERAPANSAPTEAKPRPEPLPEIVVTSSHYDIRYQPAGSHTFLDRELATRLPHLGDEALRIIARLPGAAGDGLSSRSHVRGGLQNEQLFLLDGLRLYEPYHLKDFHSIATIVDQAAIGGIDFYSAGYQAHYGDRMSGVVDIALRDPPEDTETELRLTTFHTAAVSRGRFGGDGRGDWILSGRRANLDLVADVVNPEYGAPRYQDYLAHVGWGFGRHTVSANTLYSLDKISLALPDGSEQASARYRNQVFWLKAESDWNDRLTSDTIVSATEIENRRNGVTDDPGVIEGFVDDEREFHSLALKQDWLYDPQAGWALRAGFELKRLEAEYAYASALTIAPPFDQILDNQPSETRAVDTAPRGSQFAGYTELRVRPWPALTLDVGLRWDQQTYTTASDDEQISPRFNLLWRLGRGTDLRLAWGRYYQAQEINELQVTDGVLGFHPAQRARHLVVSFARRFPAGPELRIEGYRKRYDNLMPRFENVFDPLVLIPELKIDRARIDADRALAEGVEVTLSGEGDDALAWWASYTWSRSIDVIAGEDVPRSWDQTHAVTAGVSRDWRAWSFSAAVIARTGWPKTLLLAEPVQRPDGTADLALGIGPRNGSRHDFFGSLDLRVSRRFDLPKGELTTFAEVTNATNRSNPCCTDYSVGEDEDGDPALLADEGSWLPIVPSLGIIWRF
ncbi:MAG TPA: TonB-dependent receptor [Woeseiaceae bacterium]